MKQEREYLSELINDSYGSPEKLAKFLDLGIEMLFYLEEDTFREKRYTVRCFRYKRNYRRPKTTGINSTTLFCPSELISPSAQQLRSDR